MHTDIKTMQKWIIIGAIILGTVICLGGLSYKYFLVEDIYKKKSANIPDHTLSTVTNNTLSDRGLYSKLQFGLPVKIVVFGDESTWLKQTEKMIIDKFRSSVESKSFVNYKGTSWSSLISLDSYHKSNTSQPDLIIYNFGKNDQLELSLVQFSSIYETILRTTRQNYPSSEIIILQDTSLPVEFKEAQNQLAKHYNLPLVLVDKPNDNASKILDLLSQRANNKVLPLDIDQVKPLYEINRYSSPKRLEEYTQSQLMEIAKVNDGAPRLIGEQEGALVESKFTGTTVGVQYKCVPDGGLARLYVDNKRYAIIDTYAPEPTMRTILVADDLPQGEHVVTLRALGIKKSPSQGTRIIWYGFDVAGK